ncbi:MAG: ribosome-associated translation inhibitor RaiA [Candidatus Aminicenantes bacterium]|nr:ribosome-associated translation inhibitor RaiA [Candidatus Aminicenantes bacterium]
MNIRFTTRQMELTPEIKSYCEKRLKSFSKLLRPPVEVDLILSHEKYRYKIEANLKAKGIAAIAEEESANLMASLGKVFDSLEKRIKKEREKTRERKRRITREKKQKTLVAALEPETEVEEKRVIRMSDYSLKPMTVEEAIIQLDLKKRDVFVFRREENEKLAVIFRRRDGHYGLIEPE